MFVCDYLSAIIDSIFEFMKRIKFFPSSIYSIDFINNYVRLSGKFPNFSNVSRLTQELHSAFEMLLSALYAPPPAFIPCFEIFLERFLVTTAQQTFQQTFFNSINRTTFNVDFRK